MWFPYIVAVILAFVSFLYYLLANNLRNNKSRQAPEAKGAWPIIGHLHLLGGSELLHEVLAKMGDLYGPLFTIRLGVKRAIVVTNWEVAKECLETNDKVFVDRPRSMGLEIMAYNQTMFGFCPYGPYWRELRKIATIELLSSRRLEILKPVREYETRLAIHEIYKKWVNEKGESEGSMSSMEMKKWFGDLNMNVILRVVVGQRLSAEVRNTSGVASNISNNAGVEAFREFFDLMQWGLISDAIPFLKWLDIGGTKKAMKKTAKKIDSILQGWLDEHKRKRSSSQEVKLSHQMDFMDVLLNIIEESTNEHLMQEDPDTTIKSACMSLLLGGSDTTTVTLTWALSLLLNNRHALKNVQDELDIHVGRIRQVEESDIKNLVYLQAVVKETMRLYPPGPILPTRESAIDFTVGGYHFPARTGLMVNIWKIQRDPNVWSAPNDLKPERFLNESRNVDVRGKSFEMIPFGSGRRICPGITYSLQLMHIILARLLHSFEFETHSGKPVDMSESPGLTNLKATPLEVLISPRLTSSLLLHPA